MNRERCMDKKIARQRTQSTAKELQENQLIEKSRKKKKRKENRSRRIGNEILTSDSANATYRFVANVDTRINNSASLMLYTDTTRFPLFFQLDADAKTVA